MEPGAKDVEARQFRKKPVVIEAIRLEKIKTEAVVEFLGGEAERNISFSINAREGTVRLVTLEGTMTARAGDWIIKGVKGEFYPCKPDIFEATYEPVSRPGGAAPGEEPTLREHLEAAFNAGFWSYPKANSVDKFAVHYLEEERERFVSARLGHTSRAHPRARRGAVDDGR
jgi:hypothetical protein